MRPSGDGCRSPPSKRVIADVRTPSSSKRPCRPHRVLCYGDSNTAGFCANGNHFSPYGRSLMKALSASGCVTEVAFCGLNGLTGEDMATKMTSPAIRDVVGHTGKGLVQILNDEGQQDLVIIMAGTNDLGKGTSPEAIIQYIQQLHSACHEWMIPTIALSPPTVLTGFARSMRPKLTAMIQSYAHRTPGVVAYFDVERLLPRSEAGGYWEPDELHFSPAGSHELGMRLAPTVLEQLKRDGRKSVQENTSPTRSRSIPKCKANCAVTHTALDNLEEAVVGLVEDYTKSYTVGQELEFHSVTHGTWIHCKVTSIAPDGSVEVNRKKGYMLSKADQARRLRIPAPRRPPLPGDIKEYFSKTHGRWIVCKVVVVDRDGSVQLDVKRGYAMSVAEQETKLRSPRRGDNAEDGPASLKFRSGSAH